MSVKTYQFYCDHCSYKRITNGSDIGDLKEIPTSPIQRGLPKFDPFSKKTVAQPALKQIKKFKCPKCGYVIKARQIKFMEQENDQNNRADGSETGSEGSSLPGEFA